MELSRFARVSADAFALAGHPVAVAPLPGGHINDSWRVDCEDGDGRRLSYLLQRVNAAVFPDPAMVMANVAAVTRHLAARLARERVAEPHRRALRLVPTRDGADWLRDADGGCWRLYHFIEGAHARSRAISPADAREAGRAFGGFLRLLADWDAPPLGETIAGFHDTAARFARLERAAAADRCGRAGAVRAELDFARAHRALADVLPPLLASGEVPLRIAHNDAKIGNVLFDDATGEALCVVDLDTVMPGSALYDFGDLVRSMASPTEEDEPDLDRVEVRLPILAAAADGYLSAAGDALTVRERALLVFAGRLLALEQGVRFLTDYLDGDRYYRTTRPAQNLDRARVQLRLVELLDAVTLPG